MSLLVRVIHLLPSTTYYYAVRYGVQAIMICSKGQVSPKNQHLNESGAEFSRRE